MSKLVNLIEYNDNVLTYFGTSIISKKCSETEANIQLYFDRNCDYLTNFSSDYMFIPEVIQLYLASFIAKDIFNIECSSGQFRKIKFLNLIKPNEILNLQLEYTPRGINYSYSDKETIYSSGQLPIRNYWK